MSEVRDPVMVQEGFRNVPSEGTESDIFDNDIASVELDTVDLVVEFSLSGLL